MNELMKTTKASDIMKTQFSMISPEDSYEKIIQLYTTASEKNFLVFAKGNDVIGCIPELYIKDVLKRDNKDILVKDLINLHFGIFPSYTSLEQLMTVMKEKGLSIVGVEEDQMVVGVIDRNLLQNFIILKNS
ncbi:MAG: hypothetical protein IPG79_13695 [Saprospiraceae bacterium]|nr:hypothetical protein [Saprospiraceae bacterium]